MAKNIISICKDKILPLEKKLDKETIFKFTKDRRLGPFDAIKIALESIYKIKPELEPKESGNKFKEIPKQENDKGEYKKDNGCISF